MQPTGIHIAFAAGTGVLCFVDLVGHLIQARLGWISEQMVDLDLFKFIFYVSFDNESESIALELLEAFSHYCERHGYLNFDLHVRLKDEFRNEALWDREFIV